jgi:hypothetical protein
MTSRSHKGCSEAPESDLAPYGREYATGAHVRRIRVHLPAEAPMLTPGAARVLLRILLKARARLSGKEKE